MRQQYPHRRVLRPNAQRALRPLLRSAALKPETTAGAFGTQLVGSCHLCGIAAHDVGPSY
jgi:hypothetical protein